MEFIAGRRNLICALDWGIGHASRSLALAQRLVQNGEQVDFAAAGNALKMLQREWSVPALFHQLAAYNIDYRSSNMVVNIGRQLPRILRVIFQERQQLNTLLTTQRYDRIISDSRFGCYSKAVPSVMLTHQLQPIFGLPLVGGIYRSYLQNNFGEFWVPDYAPPMNLSGALSTLSGYKTVSYIGSLSRLSNIPTTSEQVYDYGCLLSGPEPQRTYFEEMLINQLSRVAGHHWIVAGRPGQSERSLIVDSPTTKIERISFSPAALTSLLLRQSKKIICRSGYSTLMDLDKLGIQDILLVPTPGQTEQIYLAKRWAELGRARWVRQEDFTL